MALTCAAAPAAAAAVASASAARPHSARPHSHSTRGAVSPTSARSNPLRRRGAAARPRAAPIAAAAPIAVASALHDVLDATTTTTLEWLNTSPMDVSPLLTLGAIGDDVAMGLFTAAQSADSLVAGKGLHSSTFQVILSRACH